MPSKSRPKKWPHYAKWARDDTATHLQEIINIATQLQTHDDLAVAAAAGRIVHRAHKSIRDLVQVGAEMPDAP